MLLVDLERRELIKPPTFLSYNTHYLTRMGSVCYGVATDNSDQDIYGVVIPPRDYIFPPNYIEGFDNRDLTFHHWQKHGVIDKSANGGKGVNYDFSIYNIVNYFKLCMDNNPNCIDSLFVRREHIIHITEAWENVRNNRKLFLHKGVVYKLKGYAFSQLKKAENATKYVEDIRKIEKDYGIPHETTFEDMLSSLEIREKLGYHYTTYHDLYTTGMAKTNRFYTQKMYSFDPKFMYHIFRLCDQAEYILNHHDLDLQENSRVEKMKAIRRGDITFEDIVKHFSDSELRLNNLYESSTLRKYPPKDEIRQLLLTTLESHYGSLSAFLKSENAAELAVKEIRLILGKFNL